MSIFQRVVLLIKVLVLMSLGMSAAWAHNPVQSQAGLSAVQSEQGKFLHLAKSEAETDDQDQDDSEDNGSDSADPDDDDGDSQT